jgi:hypothetical protein
VGKIRSPIELAIQFASQGSIVLSNGCWYKVTLLIDIRFQSITDKVWFNLCLECFKAILGLSKPTVPQLKH